MVVVETFITFVPEALMMSNKSDCAVDVPRVTFGVEVFTTKLESVPMLVPPVPITTWPEVRGVEVVTLPAPPVGVVVAMR